MAMQNNSRLRIVLIGGGSMAWTPRIVRDVLLTDALSNSDFVLLDIDRKAAELNARFLKKLNAQLGTNARFTVATDRPRALAGADYVLITISTGGLDAMAHDLAIPEKFGIYHTVGDTTGPGGWARLIRNFDVFVSIARDLNRYAPRAIVLNYTNPMSTLTDVLCRICRAPVVGLCHGLFENLEFFKRFYKLASEDEMAVQYAGLNHFFWITQARAGKLDIIADMQRRLRRRNLSDLLRDTYQDAMGFQSDRYVADELFRLTGALPYFGDRHTCECFPHYITSRQNMRKYKLRRTSIRERRQRLAKKWRTMQALVNGQAIPREMLKRSRETAADIVLAHSQGRSFIDVGNVPNIGQITNLPQGLVVETAVRVDRNGFTPLAFGPLPEMVRAIVEPAAAAYKMVVAAAFDRNLDRALQALRIEPSCAHLNSEQVDRLGRELLRAHRKFISVF